MAEDNAINVVVQQLDFDPDTDSEPGDDLEHWLEAEETLRRRRSNLVDFGLPPHLADRDAR